MQRPNLPFERPEERDEILQRLAGLQIARVEHVASERGPMDGKVVGFEFTEGTRLILEFTADLTDGAPAPWIIRPILVMDQNMIWSPNVVRHFTRSRSQAGEDAPGYMQERIEGEVVAHAQMLPEVTARAGEQMLIMLRNAGAVLFQAEPASHGFSGQFAMSYLPKGKWWVDQPLVVPGA
jgi:hypothetical protein